MVCEDILPEGPQGGIFAWVKNTASGVYVSWVAFFIRLR